MKPEPLPYLTGSTWVCSLGNTLDVMDEPLEKSMLLPLATTPNRDSLLVLLSEPRVELIPCRLPLALTLCKSFALPNAPAAMIT